MNASYKTFAAFLVVCRNVSVVYEFYNAVAYFCEYRVGYKANVMLHDSVGHGGVKAGNSSAVLVCSNGIHGFVTVSGYIFCAIELFNAKIKFSYSRQSVVYGVFFEFAFFLIIYMLECTSAAVF